MSTSTRHFDISWIAGDELGRPEHDRRAPWWESPLGYLRNGYGGRADHPSRTDSFLIDSEPCPRCMELSEEGPAARLDRRILAAFEDAPRESRRIVEIASQANVEFEEAVRSVLRLVARHELEILQRDPVASDHAVQLTSDGLQALTRS